MKKLYIKFDVWVYEVEIKEEIHDLVILSISFRFPIVILCEFFSFSFFLFRNALRWGFRAAKRRMNKKKKIRAKTSKLWRNSDGATETFLPFFEINSFQLLFVLAGSLGVRCRNDEKRILFRSYLISLGFCLLEMKYLPSDKRWNENVFHWVGLLRAI